MNNLTIFIGDVDQGLCISAKKFNPSAFLVDSTNYKTISVPFVNQTTVFTSLGDISDSVDQIYKLLDLADEIYYCPPEQWSDNKNVNPDNVTDSMKGLTETILFHFQQQKNNVHGLNLDHYQYKKYTTLSDYRKSENKQLWIVGCSNTHGVGVLADQRYGAIVGKELDLPTSFLTQSGSSIEWAADQILRSDIRENDIVILGLTNEQRIPMWGSSQSVKHITISHRDFPTNSVNLPPKLLDFLLAHDTCKYKSYTHIEQIVNFCKKIKAKLLIVGLLSSDSFDINLHSLQEFIAYKNFNNLNYIDYGTDQEHPGPKQHQLYANFCLTHLKKLYNI